MIFDTAPITIQTYVIGCKIKKKPHCTLLWEILDGCRAQDKCFRQVVIQVFTYKMKGSQAIEMRFPSDK